jgi:RND family efflux transporter MFP subunit
VRPPSTGSAWIPVLLLAVVAAVVGFLVHQKLQSIRTEDAGGRRGSGRPIPVGVAPIRRGPIELRRTFVGALEAPAAFAVAPKVGGRIKRLELDLGDPVPRGRVVAWLDDDEFVQSVAQAEADLAVANASVVEAESALAIAVRALQRVETLRERGVASDQQLDVARADEQAKRARRSVAEAQVKRAEAALEAARIRLSYTKVTADWTGGDDERVVAERHAEPGDNLAANAPILTVVELDPLHAALSVTERDFARLRPGQTATLTTDAYPDETFRGTIVRIAPVFREATRQARVELTVPNSGQRLKPGLFVRASLVLDRIEEATLPGRGPPRLGPRRDARAAPGRRRLARLGHGFRRGRGVSLPSLSVRRPVFTSMVTLMVVVLGGFALTRLRTDMLPNIELPTVSIRTDYEGASPEVMERLVTRIVEEIVATVPGVEEITSVSSEGAAVCG